MAIVINKWVVFDVFSDDELTESFGQAISGFVISSDSPRLEVGKRVCTAGVIDVCMTERLVRTKSGESYSLKGNGQFIQISIEDFDVFSRTGFSHKLFENHLSMEQIPHEIKRKLDQLFKKNEGFILEWLTKSKPPLNGKAPIEVLSTEKGIERVLGMLERMRTGDFS